MTIWYKGFEAIGTNPRLLVERVAQQVERFDLGRFVPIMRVEKRGAGRFCFFLAIESSTIGEIPREIQNTLFYLPFFKRQIDGAFTYEQIRPMVGAQHDIHDYARLIPYWRPRHLPDENPFDLVSQTRNRRPADDVIQTRTQRYDHLLLWLSAVGVGSWDIFRSTCQTLGLDSDGMTSQRILRRLRLLGHIETSPDGRRWTITPPSLVRIDDQGNEATYILCGARDATLLDSLRRCADVETVLQFDGSAPTIIRLQTTDAEALVANLSNFTYQLRDAGSAAYHLAQLLPTLTDWKDSLPAVQGIVPHLFEVKQFNGVDFVDAIFSEGTSGFYHLSTPGTQQSAAARSRYILFYDATKRRWLRGDWYGLRFLTLQSSGTPRPIRYDTTANQLAIFEDWRWPELYERALVLASGQLPHYNQQYLIYNSISPQLLAELSAKLNLHYEEM